MKRLFLALLALAAGALACGGGEGVSNRIAEPPAEEPAEVEPAPTAEPAPAARAEAPRKERARAPARVSRSCCKVCTKGRACGDTCIRRSAACHVGRGCACNAGEL